MGPEKGTSRVQLLGESSEENTTRGSENGERDKGEFQENSKCRQPREIPKEDSTILVKVCEDRAQATNLKEGSRHEETESGGRSVHLLNLNLGQGIGLEGFLWARIQQVR